MNSTPFVRACARFFRYTAWTVIIVFILVASLYIYLDLRAQKRWAKVEAMLKREGETIVFTDLLPPRLPEEANYAALPELRGINVVEDGDEKKGTPGANRAALLDLVSDLEGTPTAHMYQGPLLGRPLDWPRLTAVVKEAGYLPEVPPEGGEAETFRKTLEAKHPLLKTLAVASRPFLDAEWVPPLRDQTLPAHLMELRFPHYNPVQRSCRALSLHGVAAAESGDAKAALDDYRTIFLLNKAMVREPFMIGHLVSMVNHRSGFEIVWSLLRLRELQEEDLARLQALIAAYQPEEDYLLSLRGELVSGLNSLEALAKDPTGMELFSLAGTTGKAGDFRSLIWRAVPDSFFTDSRSALVELGMNHLIRPMKSHGTWAVIQQEEALNLALRGGGTFDTPAERMFARLFLPATMLVAKRTFQVEVMRRQALIACALERYFIQAGRYPERLDELLPKFLASVPLDPVDQSPLRYRRTETGRYLIWSVATDGVDDDGKVNPGSGSNPASGLTKADYQGDWTWQYVPVELPPAEIVPEYKGSGLPPLPGRTLESEGR